MIVRSKLCPFCKSPRVSERPDKTLRCANCGAWFDHDPDEGGDYSDRRPDARLQREERKRTR